MSAKKKGLLIVLVVAMVVTTITGVYALFRYTDSAVNTFELSCDETKIIENFIPPDELDQGVSFKKEPYVKNTGSVACYVRMFAQVDNSHVAEELDIDYNLNDWERRSDGFYYYKDILEPGDKTQPLFTKVKVHDDADMQNLSDFNMIIYSESVQSKGYENIDEAFQSMLE